MPVGKYENGKRRGAPRNRERESENDITHENRRQVLVRLRMNFPPLSIRQLAETLKCSTATVMKDLKFLRTQFSSSYFAENNMAAVTRACAELEGLCGQFLSEAQALPHDPEWTNERSNLYGRALQALENRNKIMMECGIISKAAIKIETSGPNGQPIAFDVTTASIEERIRMLKTPANPSAPPING